MFKDLFRYTLFISFSFVSLLSIAQVDSSKAPYSYLNPGLNINSKWAEMNPQINADDSKLYFVREDHQKNKHFQEVWCSEKDSNDHWKPAYKLKAPMNKGLTNSVVYVSPGGKDLLVKGFYKKGKYKGRGYSISHYIDNNWTTPKGIEIEEYLKMDVGVYNNACMSPDEKVIIFSFCETKGGNENSLYISFKDESEKFSKPQKLNAPINIDGSFDFSPFISDDGLELFFSSNRDGGLGGNDIYKCKRLDESWLVWSEPENMGDRVNTDGRDSYFSMDAQGNYGYMVSDINSIGKSDIVIVKLKEHFPQLIFGQVIDTLLNKKVPAKINIHHSTNAEDMLAISTDSIGAYETKLTNFGHYLIDIDAEGYDQKVDTLYIKKNNKKMEKILLTHYLEGVKLKKVFIETKDKKHLKAKIKGTDPPTIIEKESGRDGRIAIGLKEGNVYNIEINKIGFEEYKATFEVPKSKVIGDSTFTYIIELKALKPILENIYFDNNKSTTDLISSDMVNNLLFYLAENELIKLRIEGHTDDVGQESYNLELSKRRAIFVANYLTNKGVNKSKIQTKGYGESTPLIKETTPEARAKNRRIEFKFVE